MHAHRAHRTVATAKLIGCPRVQLMGLGGPPAHLRRLLLQDHNIMWVGGGDSAMEEALSVAPGRKVEVVHRRDSLRASKIMQERALKNPKISFTLDTVVEDVLDPSAGKVTGVRLRNLKTGAQWETPVDGLFVAIGHEPNTAIFRSQIALHDNNYIKVEPGTTRTSVAGVFAAGDVQDFTYRQAVTAGSEHVGAEAERYLGRTSSALSVGSAARRGAPAREHRDRRTDGRTPSVDWPRGLSRLETSPPNRPHRDPVLWRRLSRVRRA